MGGNLMAKIAVSQKNGQSRKAVTLGQKGFISSENQEIERLAYQFFVERGYEHGHDQEDWARAEAIIRNRRS